MFWDGKRFWWGFGAVFEGFQERKQNVRFRGDKIMKTCQGNSPYENRKKIRCQNRKRKRIVFSASGLASPASGLGTTQPSFQLVSDRRNHRCRPEFSELLCYRFFIREHLGRDLRSPGVGSPRDLGLKVPGVPWDPTAEPRDSLGGPHGPGSGSIGSNSNSGSAGFVPNHFQFMVPK